MRFFCVLAIIGLTQAFKLEESESVWYAKQGLQSLATTSASSKSESEAKYGDITVTISKHALSDPNDIPERYSQDSDDSLMNWLIKDGYAFSRDVNSELKITLDCGCNCNCCFG